MHGFTSRDRFEVRLMELALIFACFAIALLAFVARAAEPAAAAAPAQAGWLGPVLQYVVAPMLPLLVTALTGVAAMGWAWVRAHTSNVVAQKAFGVAEEVVGSFVAHADTAIVPMVAAAAADGVVTDDEWKKIKAQLLTLVKEQMPGDTKAVLEKTLGPALETWLSGKVEQAAAAQGVGPSANPQKP